MPIDFSKYAEMDSEDTLDFSKYAEMDAPKKPPTANTAMGAPRFNVGEAVGQAGSHVMQSLLKQATAILDPSRKASVPAEEEGDWEGGSAPARNVKDSVVGVFDPAYRAAGRATRGTQRKIAKDNPDSETASGQIGRGVGDVTGGLVGGGVKMANPELAAGLAGSESRMEPVGESLRHTVSAGMMAATPGATAHLGAKAIPATAVSNYIASILDGASTKEALVNSGVGSVLTALHLLPKKPAKFTGPLIEPDAVKPRAGFPTDPPALPAPPVPEGQRMIEGPGSGTMGASKLPNKETLALGRGPDGAISPTTIDALKKAREAYRTGGIDAVVRPGSPMAAPEVVQAPKIGNADPIQIKAQVGMDAARKKLIDGLLGRLDELRKAPESPEVRRAFNATVKKLRAAGWQPEEGFVPTRLREQVGTELPEPPAPKPPTEPVPFKIGKNGPEGSPNTPEDVALLKKWLAGKRAERVAAADKEVFDSEASELAQSRAAAEAEDAVDAKNVEPILPRVTVGNWVVGSIADRVHGIIRKASPQIAEDFWKRARHLEGSTAGYRGEIAGAGGDDAQHLANKVSHLAKDNGSGGSGLRDLLEGRRQPANPKEATFRDLVWSVQKKTGEIAKSLGALKGDPDGKLRIQFVTGTTKEMMNDDPAFRQALTDKLVQLNSSSPAIMARAAKAKMSVEDFIRKIISEREESAAHSSVVMPPSSKRQIAAEMQRELTWPDYLKYKGKNVEVLESNPHNYVSRLLDQYSRRLAFVKHFESGGGFEKYLQSVKAGTIGNPKIEEAVRTFARLANGMNEGLHTGTQVDPWMKKVGGVLMGVENVARFGKLTASAVNQVADMLPWAPMYRWTSKGESVLAIRKVMAQEKGWTRADLSREGLITKNAPNESFDPGKPVSSTMRNAINRASEFVGLRQLNEFGNEYMAAAQVKMALNRMRSATKPNQKDVGRLIEMGYNMNEAKAIAGGKGSEQEYKDIGAALVNRMVSQPTLPTQRSPLEYNTAAQLIFRIGRRWGTEAGRRAMASVKAAKLAAQAGDPRMAAKIAGRAAIGAVVGGTSANVITQLGMAQTTGGDRGLHARISALKTHPKEELMGAFLGGNIAGPFSGIQSALQTNDPLKRLWEGSAAQPYIEAGRVAREDWPYKNLPPGEKAWKATRRMVPVTKVVENLASGAARMMGDKKLPARQEAESSGDDLARWIAGYGSRFKKDNKWNEAAATKDLMSYVGPETYAILVKNQMIPWLKKTKGFVPEYRK